MNGSGEISTKVYRDAGLTLGTNAFLFTHPQEPLSNVPLLSCFGYAISTRMDPDDIGTVGSLRRLNYPIC